MSASEGVSQMTIPSRYRSLLVWGAAAGAGCTEVLAGSVDASGALESEAATVLIGCAAGDCPEAEVVKNVADVNANAAETLMSTPGLDTWESPSRSHPEMIEVQGLRHSPSHRRFP